MGECYFCISRQTNKFEDKRYGNCGRYSSYCFHYLKQKLIEIFPVKKNYVKYEKELIMVISYKDDSSYSTF